MQRWRLSEPKFMLEPGDGRRREVVLILRAEHRDQYAELEWEGDAELVALAEDRLLVSGGYQGHVIERSTTPLDLACAMRGPQMAPFDPVQLEGGITPPMS